MMFDVLGYPRDHPDVKIARASIDKLLVIKPDEAYCQPCVSPVWDTVLTAHALLDAGGSGTAERVKKGLDWLKPLQVLDVAGDWIAQSPGVRPGGWAFQYANPHYPDLDDTAVVVMAMDRAEGTMDAKPYRPAIERAREWIVGLQSRDGGWAAFDANNDREYLNNIPFSDHGALLDPPTADLTARCLSMLAQLGEKPETSPAMARAIEWLRRDQHPEGSWYGRWGMNYIYGTWSVLCALNAAHVPHDAPEVRKASNWLISIQNSDGGWGEDGASYKLDYRGHEAAPSTASQTAWALLGLMAAGETDHPAVARGIDYLLRTQGGDGFWSEQLFTATGFPRVFYLRYHGYPKFFPLWALARYRNLKAGNTRSCRVRHVSNASDILVVTGATFEADIAAGDGVTTICSGADPVRLRKLLDEIDPRSVPRRDQLWSRGRTASDIAPRTFVDCRRDRVRRENVAGAPGFIRHDACEAECE